jgi:hypothetical protein
MFWAMSTFIQGAGLIFPLNHRKILMKKGFSDGLGQVMILFLK